ncbi:T6SS phospholipase effector Tle1-like catalytic domain-containing protein [Collimonas humicola]|uniref:T6SS phospholipase effector Tle1-like catalytic domain-containing protein n=1 Tax=Collimonas humicola TaxID=2825886 RepID=UPI001B8CFA26|nr:DUF2235 domain-containing protein [Collimonas humicola]
MTTSAPTSYLAPVKVKCHGQLPHGTCLDCKSILNVGIFFDGTDNNLERDKPQLSHSNVARLSDAYRVDPFNGFFSYYIPGVGTKFELVGEMADENAPGSAFGKGGEARIVCGLLQVLNAMHSFVNDAKRMFEDEQITALTSEHPTPQQNQMLREMGLCSGLVGDWMARSRFLARRAGELKMQLEHRDTVPNISGVYLDVFGFSRGSAQARVFCNWLHQDLLLPYSGQYGKLCGVPAYVRMLGIFDTVASVGTSNATGGGDGHRAWASYENLRIHSDIKNCVHFAALHEFRTVFPLDSVCVNGKPPPNCSEHVGPGGHSDLGGGYAPGEQGKAIQVVPLNPFYPDEGSKATSDDSRKLSQLPLNLMLAAARKSCENHGVDGVAWLDFKSAAGVTRNLSEQFALHNSVPEMVRNYFEKCGVDSNLPLASSLREHGIRYLSWRYQLATIRNGFNDLTSVKYASQTNAISLDYYRRGENIFEMQLAQKGIWGLWAQPTKLKDGYQANAQEIMRRLKSAPDTPYGIRQFFDGYVHDSYAGFIEKFEGASLPHDQVEVEGYLRYRSVYLGDNKRLNALLETPPQKYA